ncbi:MAG TPA: AAA family ATPase [Pilimelia sp.]|nr:AAA family ATPase [Pilimelia sp.]
MTLTGREEALEACAAALAAEAGCTAVVICGERGIGKTTVWRAGLDRARSGGRAVLAATAVRAQAAVPYAGLTDLLDPAARPVLPTLPAVQRDALAAALRLAPPPAVWDGALVARAVVNVLRALGRDAPVVAVDDEQWLDSPSRQALDTAAATLADIRVTWLVAGTEGPGGGGLLATLPHRLGGRATTVALGPLDEDALLRLVLDRFPARWSPRLLRRVIALAAGNPYAAVELARESASAGDAGAPAAVPHTLAASLSARLRRLSPRARAVAQTAALTRRPTRRVLAAVTGAEVAGAIEQGVAAAVLDAAPPDPVLRFTHPLLREVTGASLSGPQRRRLHRRLAHAVDDPQEAVRHAAAAAEEPDARLAAIAAAAAGGALAGSDPERAVVLAEHAVHLTPPAPADVRWRRRLLLLDCLREAGESARAAALAAEWEAAVPPPLRGEFLARQGRYAGDPPVAARLLTEAAAECVDSPRLSADVRTELATVVGVRLLRLAEGRRHAATAVRDAHRTGDPAVLRAALAAQSLLAALAGDPAAGTQLRAAAALPDLAGMMLPHRSPEARLALWHTWRGELDAARELHHRVLRAARRCGSEESVQRTRLHLVEVEWRAGRWAEAAAHADAVDLYHRATGAAPAAPRRYVSALVAAGNGDVDRARALAVEGADVAARRQDLVYGAHCRAVLGLLALSVDDPAAAVGWLAPLAPLWADSGVVEPGLVPFGPDLAEAWARTGHLDEAAALRDRLRGAAARLGHPWAAVAAARAGAVLDLAARRPGAAVDALLPAVAAARATGLRFEVGRCLLLLGTAQRRDRQRRAAARSLAEADRLFAEIGAPRWREVAAQQHAQLTRGCAGRMTPAEERIAGLIARGLSNAEIAAALSVSVKTVEANATRIYRKCGVRGRVGLAERLRGAGAAAG